MDTRDKILSREGLHDVLEEHRCAGRRIVFANGVFDLLHVGHIRYLQAARAEGDCAAGRGRTPVLLDQRSDLDLAEEDFRALGLEPRVGNAPFEPETGAYVSGHRHGGTDHHNHD